MTNLDKPQRKRKLLHLKTSQSEPDLPHEFERQTKWLEREECVFMVWSVDGGMPRRVYTADEISLACDHAKALTRKNGVKFYVMRSWRGFAPVDDEVSTIGEAANRVLSSLDVGE